MAMRIYGWQPDRPDFRDVMYTDISSQAALPSKFSMRSGFPSCYDQGELGSCTANALCGGVAYTLIKNSQLTLRAANTNSGIPSRLFVYYNERVLEGTVNIDAGATLRSGIKTLAKQGVCFEKVWPYVINQFTRRPSTIAYKQALLDILSSYQRIETTNLIGMKTAISQSTPFVFGVSVYESFESDAVARTGIVPIPKSSESALGGHAMLAIGYDDNMVIGSSKGAFEVRNSWGIWGDGGHCWMPYDYIANPRLCGDIWVIKAVI